jgi:hypothetical protein
MHGCICNSEHKVPIYPCLLSFKILNGTSALITAWGQSSNNKKVVPNSSITKISGALKLFFMDQRQISKLMKKLKNLFLTGLSCHLRLFLLSSLCPDCFQHCHCCVLLLSPANARAREHSSTWPFPSLSSSTVLSSIIFLHLALFSNRAASRALLRCSDKSLHLGEDSVTVPFSLEPGAWSCHPRCPEPSAAALPVELGHVHRPALIGEGATARLSS